MTKIYNFEEFSVNESEVNEGLFSSIKRRKALNQLSSHAQELYDAIVKKYDIDIESHSYYATKEFRQLSRAAQLKKEEAYDQRKRAAEELISELREKCQNDISSRSDDDKFNKKAKDIITDAESRARKEVMRKAEQEISSTSLKDLRTEFDDELDDEWGPFSRYLKGYKPSAYEKSKESERTKMKVWKDKHKGWICVPSSYISYLQKYSSLDISSYWEETDGSKDKLSKKFPDYFVIAPNGEYYGKPTEDFKSSGKDWQKFKECVDDEEKYNENCY